MTRDYYDECDHPLENYMSDCSHEGYNTDDYLMEDEHFDPNFRTKSQLTYEDETDVSPQAEWKLIKIGITKLKVSNEGKLFIVESAMWPKLFITEGLRYAGSPYRYIDIEVTKGNYTQYYVHDIVWRSFKKEDIPEGWEVRHSDYTPMDDGQCYLNHIDYLDAYKKTTSRDITVENLD